MPLENIRDNSEPFPMLSIISYESCSVDPIVIFLYLDLPIALKKGIS